MGCINQKVAEDTHEHKLLLLGRAGVGKSTVFKQVKKLHTAGFTPEEKEANRNIIGQQMVSVLLECVNVGIKKRTLEITPQLEDSHKFLESLPNPLKIEDSKALSDNITYLWGLPDIKKILNQVKNESLKVKESEAMLEWADYFLDKAERIFDKSCPLTDEDLIRLRRETSGVQSMSFTYQKKKMNIVDVGGQNHERSTWEPEFKDALAVIYMVSLSDYDSMTQGKGGVNKFAASFILFQDLASNPHLQSTPFIVLLNKSDVFAKKIKEVGLDLLYPDVSVDHKNNYEYCIDYLTLKYEEIKRDIATEVYVTNATDTRLIEEIFDRITHSVLSRSLKSAGMD